MTMMPRPPNQWVRDRHSKMPCGMISKSGMTVAPVPDKPEMHSNTPSSTDK